MEHHPLNWRDRGLLWARLGVRAVLIAAAVLLAVYALPPLLSLFLPFVLALMVAWLLNPLVRWLQRRLSVSRKVVSLVLILLIFCAIGALLYALGRMAVEQVSSLFENWPTVVQGLISALNGVSDRLRAVLPDGLLPPGGGLGAALGRWLDGLDLSGWLTSLAGQAPSLMSGLSGFAVGTTAFVMASYFITGDYPRLRFLVTDRVPAGARSFCGAVRRIFMDAFGGYLKSQLLLSLGVFLILAAGFLLIRQPYGLLLAAGLAVLDFIPIVGAGTVMVPWAAVDLLVGGYAQAAQLAVIWGIIALFRRIAEPKILGDQTGLSPILSLVGVYVGMRAAGVLGMIVGPLLLLVVLNLGRLGAFEPLLRDLRAAVRDVMALLTPGE